MENKNYGLLKFLVESAEANEGIFKYTVSGNGDIVTISTSATSGESIKVLRSLAFQVLRGIDGDASYMYEQGSEDDEDDEDDDTFNYRSTKRIFSQLQSLRSPTKSLTNRDAYNFKGNKLIIGFKKKDKEWVETAARELVKAAQSKTLYYSDVTKKEREYRNSPEYKAQANKYKSDRAKEKKEKLLTKYPASVLKRVSARKYLGDDQGSWAVFIDGRPFVTGLTQREVNYYKDKAYQKLFEK